MNCQLPRSRTILLGGILVTIAMVLSFVSRSARAALEDRDAIRLVKHLEQEDPEFLIDMHGNADASLKRLEVLRFDATAAVQAEIDRMESDPRRATLVGALYRVLGFVKDPASTSWIEKKLSSPQRELIYARYMRYWHDGIGFGFGNNEGFGGWRWLVGRDRWITFFIGAHQIEPSSDRRVELMNILKGFDDPAAMQFFKAQREIARDPREILLVEAYLRQHDVPADGVRIAAAIDALKGDPGNRDLLVGTADALRHEAFVPYLIGTLDVAEQNVTPPQYLSQYVLEDTTFELDIESREAWNTWYSKHLTQNRAQWVQSAIASFTERLKRDPAGAKEWFAKKASYRWNDLGALPMIRTELLPNEEFHSEIAGWVNMTYTEFRRPKLKPIADELARRPEKLEDWAKTLLVERGLMPLPHAVTWEEYVKRSNMQL